MTFMVNIDKNIKLKLYNMNKSLYKKHFINISQILFEDDIVCFVGKNFKSDNFFSLFIQDRIYNNKLIYSLDNDIDVTKEVGYFYMFNIYEGNCGISHLGIVNYISDVFIRNNISILYINTFNENIILVPEKDLEKSLNCLHQFIDIDKIKID
jgi:hypothetical protein